MSKGQFKPLNVISITKVFCNAKTLNNNINSITTGKIFNFCQYIYVLIPTLNLSCYLFNTLHRLRQYVSQLMFRGKLTYVTITFCAAGLLFRADVRRIRNWLLWIYNFSACFATNINIPITFQNKVLLFTRVLISKKLCWTRLSCFWCGRVFIIRLMNRVQS